MSEWISPRQFHEADGVEDWRVLGEGACAYFRTGSFAAGGRLVTDEHAPDGGRWPTPRATRSTSPPG
jgi:4a-hydroxytetrahydrobiopterin dehydratase